MAGYDGRGLGGHMTLTESGNGAAEYRLDRGRRSQSQGRTFNRHPDLYGVQVLVGLGCDVQADGAGGQGRIDHDGTL